jgi:hypothetical protein
MPKPVQPPKPAFDESGVGVGTKVFHRAFGHGVVTEVRDKPSRAVEVLFEEESKPKPFVFPNAFLQGFLKIED